MTACMESQVHDKAIVRPAINHLKSNEWLDIGFIHAIALDLVMLLVIKVLNVMHLLRALKESIAVYIRRPLGTKRSYMPVKWPIRPFIL